MSSGLKTRPAQSHADVAAFFDACAPTYADQHGDAERLLRYRLSLVRAAARLRPGDVVLEIGCGTGFHLLALAAEYGRGLGVDLSPAMVDVARGRCGPGQRHVAFAVDAAERLATLADGSVDVVLAIGALEHMLDQGAVCRSVFRVLKPGGRFICLTLNGGGLRGRHPPARDRSLSLAARAREAAARRRLRRDRPRVLDLHSTRRHAAGAGRPDGGAGPRRSVAARGLPARRPAGAGGQKPGEMRACGSVS